MIKFGDGDDDFVSIGPNSTNDSSTVTAGTLAQVTDTITDSGSITKNQISFGNGSHDFVELSPSVASTQTATATTSGTADANATVSVIFGDISSNVIKFGNGDGDFVQMAPIVAITSQAENATGTGTVSPFIGIAIDGSQSEIANNTITFGNGNGDFVSDNGDFFAAFSGNQISFAGGNGDFVSITGATTITNNHIQMGNGTGDYVSLLGSSSNNFIGLGNGSGDAVTLGSGAGGDNIVTGTGLDTVTVGDHRNADFFNFALNTNGSSFTTITGAQIRDSLSFNGNHLGSNVVNSSTSATTLADFIAGLVLTNGNTYVGTNGTDTFVVTDYNGQVGAVELVGVFSGHTFSAASHVLTLEAGLHF